MFSCNLPPALLAEWAGSFTHCCGNTGVERIPKVSIESAQKVDPGEENPHAAPAGTRTRDLSITSPTLRTTELSTLLFQAVLETVPGI